LARGASSAGSPAPPLEAERVSAGYAVSKHPPPTSGRAVLRDLTFELHSGELVVVIGPNGAGKSTLLRVLSGTLRPHAGTTRLFGRDLATLTAREVARQVAVVSQASEVAFGFRVEQVVMMGRSPHQGGLQLASDDDVKAVREAMERTGILELAGRAVSELSGGEQKMVALARALAQRPDVLLLDEPSAHLDPKHGVMFFELLAAEVRQGRLSCVAVAHDLNLAAAFADRVVLLHEGRVHSAGSVDEVMTPENLRAVFGVELHVETSNGGRYFVPRRQRFP
jgi:iron complex transport system ATP-binding protein